MKLVAVLAATSLAAGVQQSDFQYTRVLPNAGLPRHVGFEPDGLLLAHARTRLRRPPRRRCRRCAAFRGASFPTTVFRSVCPWRCSTAVGGNAAVALVDVGPAAACTSASSSRSPAATSSARDRFRRGCAQRPVHETLDHDRVRRHRGQTRPKHDDRPAPDRPALPAAPRVRRARLTGATVLGEFERPNLVRRRHAVLAARRSEHARASTRSTSASRDAVTRLSSARRFRRPTTGPSVYARTTAHVRAARQRRMTRAPALLSLADRAHVALPLPPRDDRERRRSAAGVRQDRRRTAVVRLRWRAATRARSVCSTART